MASRSNFGFGKDIVEGSNRGGNADKVAAPRRSFLSSVNVQILEDFVMYCEAKKVNPLHEGAQGGNVSFDAQANAVDELTSFRNDVTMRFGDQLPSYVVDELCKLVIDNTHGKCRSCKMPTESLILSVLQILTDAAQVVLSSKENIAPPPVAFVNSKADGNAMLSASKGIVNSMGRDFPTHCSQQEAMCIGAGFSQSMKCSKLPIDQPAVPINGIRGIVSGFEHPIHSSRTPNIESAGPLNNVHTLSSVKISSHDQKRKESSDFLHDLKMGKQTLVLDTPMVMCQRNRTFHELASIPEYPPVINKKPRVAAAVNHMFNAGNLPNENILLGKQAVPQATQPGDNSSRPVILLSGDSSNSGAISYKVGPGQRFLISEQDARYYKVICDLGHSKFSGQKAVEFSLTSVTFWSLGKSVEPGGKCDNFFMAGMCRYFFEHVHPRQSKKHFFYPKIGGSLYNYKSPDDIKNVQKSFVGANLAYKLHRSDKLIFPLAIGNHWFVFIVDLVNHRYVFLDSYFNENSNFQAEARTKLMDAFKESWYQYAEGFVSLEDFTYVYPPVPKQTNAFDCGIFAVKFMELWDFGLDLNLVFDQSDIPNIRVQLAVNMFFSFANSIDKSIVTSLSGQGIHTRISN